MKKLILYSILLIGIVYAYSCKKDDNNPSDSNNNTPRTFTYKQFTGNSDKIYGYYASTDENVHAYFIGNLNSDGDFASVDKIYLRNISENRSSCLKLDQMGRPRYWIAFDTLGQLKPFAIEFAYEVEIDDTLYNIILGVGVDWTTNKDSVLFSIAKNTFTNEVLVSKMNDQELDQAINETILWANCSYPWVCDLMTEIAQNANQTINNLSQSASDLRNDFVNHFQDFTNTLNILENETPDNIESINQTYLNSAQDPNINNNINTVNNSSSSPDLLFNDDTDSEWWCNMILTSGTWTQMPFVDDGNGNIVQGHPNYVSGWFLKFIPTTSTSGTVQMTAMPPYTGTSSATYNLIADYGSVSFTFLGCFHSFFLKPGVQEYKINGCGGFDHHLLYK